jgi:hypothetical protein
VVIDSDGELLLGLFLADYVLVEERLDLLRLGKMIRSGRWTGFGAIIFEDGIADGDAFIADIGPRIIAGRRD